MKKLLFLNIVLLILLSCKENEKEITLKSTEFLELNEKFEIYNGSIPNGWNGDIMVAMSGTVLADRRSVDGGVMWGPRIPLLGGAGRILDETTGDILKLDPGGAGKKPENFMYRSKDNGQTWVKEDIATPTSMAGCQSFQDARKALPYDTENMPEDCFCLPEYLLTTMHRMIRCYHIITAVPIILTMAEKPGIQAHHFR
jgi:hypothetical protein